LNFARKLEKNEDDARDLVQQVIFLILSRVPNPSLITQHAGYAMAVTRNLYYQELRERLRRNEVCLDDVAASDPGNHRLVTEPRLLKLLEIEDSLARAIGKDSAETFHLRIKLILAGFKSPEISEILGEPVSRTRFMKRKIFEAMRKSFGTSDAGC